MPSTLAAVTRLARWRRWHVQHADSGDTSIMLAPVLPRGDYFLYWGDSSSVFLHRQTSSANRNTISCGTSQQSTYFRFPKYRKKFAMHWMHQISKLSCAARSVNTIPNYDAARPEYRGLWFLPLVLPPNDIRWNWCRPSFRFITKCRRWH